MNVSRLDSLGRPELSEGQGRFSQGRIKQAKARPYTREHGAVRALKRANTNERYIKDVRRAISFRFGLSL